MLFVREGEERDEEEREADDLKERLSPDTVVETLVKVVVVVEGLEGSGDALTGNDEDGAGDDGSQIYGFSGFVDDLCGCVNLHID